MTIPDDFIVYLLGVFASAAGLAEFYRRKVLADVEESNSHQQIINLLEHVQKIETRLNEVVKQPNYTNPLLEKDVKLLINGVQEIREEVRKMQETVSLLEVEFSHETLKKRMK